DVVLHSTTKYIGGHSDLIGGFVATNDPTVAERLYFLQKSLGAIPGPFDCWLVLRGIKTLAVRMRQHCANAHAIAGFLERHPRVDGRGAVRGAEEPGAPVGRPRIRRRPARRPRSRARPFGRRGRRLREPFARRGCRCGEIPAKEPT